MSHIIDLTEILRKAAQTHLLKLEMTVRQQLEKREQRVLDWLLRQYEDERMRRWYDPYHVLFSTSFVLDLIVRENLDRLIVPGILLHDIGYFALEDKTQWSSSESRITHMQEGVALAARVLSENGFVPYELEKVLGMIAVHDNPYIGIAIRGKDRLGLRDGDRIWVMHALSFYKDLAAKPERLHQPNEFLHDRMVQFYGWNQPFGDGWVVTLDRLKKNALRIEVPTYNYTRNYITSQFNFRVQELLQLDILHTSERFEKYLHQHLALDTEA